MVDAGGQPTRNALGAELAAAAEQRQYAAAPNDTWLVGGWRIGVAPKGPPRLLAFREGQLAEFAGVDSLVAFLEGGELGANPFEGGDPVTAERASSTRFCSGCGNAISAADAFCTTCGTPQANGGQAQRPLQFSDPATPRRPYTGPTVAARTSGLAIASLVFGILWVVGVGSLAAVVLGIVALRQIGRSEGDRSGTGLAIAGIALGSVGLVMTLVLSTIAMPTFIGARARAQDRATQSSLRNAVTAAKAIYTDNESYFDATVEELSIAETTLNFVGGGVSSSGSTDVSVESPAQNVFVAAALSDSGRCWFVRDEAGMLAFDSGGTTWNYSDVDGSCNASEAPPVGWTEVP